MLDVARLCGSVGLFAIAGVVLLVFLVGAIEIWAWAKGARA